MVFTMNDVKSDFSEKRTYPRFRLRVPNALRIISSDGECVADLLDVSMSGIGIEYFDMLNALTLSEGDIVEVEFLVTPDEIKSKEVSELLKMKMMEQNPVLTELDFEAGMEELGHLRFTARVAWTYLNRLGFELISH